MNLRILTNDELIRHATALADPLITSELETELLKRLEEAADQQQQVDAADAFLDSVNADDFDAIGSALADHNVEDVKTLREKLERADKFYDLAREAGEAFTMLAELASKTN